MLNPPHAHPPLIPCISPQALHFIEILVGPKCTELTVERPQQYHFDRERGCLAVLCLARVRLWGLLFLPCHGMHLPCCACRAMPCRAAPCRILLSHADCMRATCHRPASFPMPCHSCKPHISAAPSPHSPPTLLPTHSSSAADQLLVSMVHFLVRLADQPAFVAAVSAVRSRGGAAD